MPLNLPESYYVWRLMAIDPGLNFTGIATYDIDYKTENILSIEATTLCNDRLLDHTGFDEEYIAERTIKLYKLKQAFQTILLQAQPSMVVCEAPFYNRFRPTAYSSLLEVVNVFHAGVLELNPNISFTTLPPLSVKKFIGAKTVKNNTEKGKFEVKTAVLGLPEVMAALKTDLNTLSEHAIDAIAIGYTGLRQRGI